MYSWRCVCLTVISLFVFSFQEKPYKFTPENNYIEVNYNDDYHIAFNQIEKTKFSHCYYESDTIKGDYEIQIIDTALAPQDGPLEGLKSGNGTGICSLTYYKVDDAAPLKWTITAYDNLTKSNFTEVVKIDRYYNLPLYLKTLTVLVSGSFANFFIAKDTKLLNCTLKVDNLSINLNLDTINIYKDKVLNSQVSSLGEGRCGFKFDNLVSDKMYQSELTLLAIDEQKKVYRNISTLNVKIAPNLKNQTQEVYLGGRTTVICGMRSDDMDATQEFCHLFNPEGNLVSIEKKCKYDLDIVTKDDLGVWRCIIGYEYIMDALEMTTELKMKKPEIVPTFIEESSDYLVIGCQFEGDYQFSLSYCKFTRPDGKIFKVTTGGASKYYTTFTSDVPNGKCSIEIVKPLRWEDRGTWKCEGSNAVLGPNGAFIDVKTKSIHENKYTRKNVKLGNSFVIDCMVSYSSGYCHIVAPNGTEYRSDNPYAVNIGWCLLRVDFAVPSDNGQWKCSFAQNNGVPDDITTIDISIIELKLLYTNVEAMQNEHVEFICNTNGIPIEYCRFTSPSATTYSLRKEDVDSNTGIDYNGRGLEYGDCGIKISKVQYTDSGTWKCHISPGRYDYDKKLDISQEIKLEVASSNTSIAQSVGIAVGIVAVLIVTAGFVYFKKYRSRRNQEEETRSSSGDSGQNIILPMQQNTYNT